MVDGGEVGERVWVMSDRILINFHLPFPCEFKFSTGRYPHIMHTVDNPPTRSTSSQKRTHVLRRACQDLYVSNHDLSPPRPSALSVSPSLSLSLSPNSPVHTRPYRSNQNTISISLSHVSLLPTLARTTINFETLSLPRPSGSTRTALLGDRAPLNPLSVPYQPLDE